MSADANNTPASLRAKYLEDWRTVQKGLEDALELVEADPTDEDNLALCEDFEVQLADCVARLNASERDVGIVVTPNARFIQTAVGTSGSSSSPAGGSAVATSTACLFSEAAPYQVHYDGKRWYSCIVTSVVEPEARPNTLDRTMYKVWVLGYNVEEVVLSENLRRWQLDLPEPIAAEQKVFAVHPTLGKFMDAEVDKLTPKNTVFVKFVTASSPPADEVPLATASEEGEKPSGLLAEVPISHILNGKWYPQLRKIEKLSAADKKAKAKEKKSKKKEKDVERHRAANEAAFNTISENQEFLDL